jgi:hypothetical protein
MLQEETVPGPIDGLRLPLRAWKVLQREHITTLDQLRAAAGRIERFENKDPKRPGRSEPSLPACPPAERGFLCDPSQAHPIWSVDSGRDEAQPHLWSKISPGHRPEEGLGVRLLLLQALFSWAGGSSTRRGFL